MNTPDTIQPTSKPISQKKILLYWLPIAASWLLMGSEQPFINGTLARLPESINTLAAYGIVYSITLIIESPVISLLSTATALAKSRQNYLQLRRFTLHLMILVFVVQGLVCIDPIFHFVVHNLIGAPDHLSELIRLGLLMMLLWSPAIAWRRFTQGILIRHGKTNYISKGTLLRLCTSAGSAFLLGISGWFNGVIVASIALSLGVILEAFYAQRAVNPILKEYYSEDNHTDDQPLLYRSLVNFHLPLAGSNLLFMLINPIITAALARSPEPETALAAWPVASSFLFLTRSVVVGYPEVVIALMEEKNSQPQLLRFGITVGLASTTFLAVILFTPLSSVYFDFLLGIEPALSTIAISGARYALLLPFFTALVSFYRGILTGSGKTFPISIGMAVELFVLITAMFVSIMLKMNGVMSAGIAISLALAADMFVLMRNRQKHTHAEQVVLTT